MGQGLTRVLKIYGQIEMVSKEGKKTIWVWDYAKDKAVLKSEMTKEDFIESEKAKYSQFKNTIQ